MGSYIDGIKNNPHLIQRKIVKQSEIYHSKDIEKLIKMSNNYLSGELREMKHNIAAEYLSHPKLSGRGLDILKFINFDESAKIISNPSMPFDIKVKIISQCGQSKIDKNFPDISTLLGTVSEIIASPYMPADLGSKIIADPSIYKETGEYILSNGPVYKSAQMLEYPFIPDKKSREMIRLMQPYVKIKILADPFLSDVKAAKLSQLNRSKDKVTADLLSNPAMNPDRAERMLFFSNLPDFRIKNIIKKIEENRAIEIIIRSAEKEHFI